MMNESPYHMKIFWKTYNKKIICVLCLAFKASKSVISKSTGKNLAANQLREMNMGLCQWEITSQEILFIILCTFINIYIYRFTNNFSLFF